MAYEENKSLRMFYEDFLAAAWMHTHEGVNFDEQDFFGQLGDINMKFKEDGFAIEVVSRGRFYIAEESMPLVDKIIEKYPEEMWPVIDERR